MRWWDGITDSMDMSLSKIWVLMTEKPGMLHAVHCITKSWIHLID